MKLILALEEMDKMKYGTAEQLRILSKIESYWPEMPRSHSLFYIYPNFVLAI